MKQHIAIIHFNTPELTVACIHSIRKHGCFWPITIFDNSNERPFTKKMAGVTILDNTKGQIVDFKAELDKFPDKNIQIGGYSAEWPSTKHMLSVQKLWELLPDGFILVERYPGKERTSAYCGMRIRSRGWSPGCRWPSGPSPVADALLSECARAGGANGAKYFDPKRTFGLLADGKDRNNWYDTGGAVVLEDIVKTKPQLVALLYTHITHFYEHYRHGSWRANNVQAQKNWLEQNRQLWKPVREEVESQQIAVCAMGRMENRYAVEWVKHYKKLGFDKVFIYDNNREDEEVCRCAGRIHQDGVC